MPRLASFLASRAPSRGGPASGSLLLLTLLALTLLVLTMGACNRVPEQLQPDTVLRDSLGLDERDAVHVVALSSSEGAIEASPDSVRIEPGDHVSFTTLDGFLYLVEFDSAGLGDDQLNWLRAADHFRGPPLLEADRRWVVDFIEAPIGVYSYRVEGNAATSQGIVEVAERR